VRRVAKLLVVGLLAAPLGAQQQPPPAEPKPTQAQQRPVFRGGTHFVRVDAYPLKDGKVVEDLKLEDFEVLEDGKPQQIESFDFVKFDTFTPESLRRDPVTKQEGFDLAADPRNRVFVIFVDMAFSRSAGAVKATANLNYIQQPLSNFLDRILGPLDLYGFLSSRNSSKDLVLQRRSLVTKEQIADLWRSSVIDKDSTEELFGPQLTPNDEADAFVDSFRNRSRLDATYTTLEGLLMTLGSIRQERKSIIFVTDTMPRWRPNPALLEARGPVLPTNGIYGGRLGTNDPRNGYADVSTIVGEQQRLANIDFDQRFRDLLTFARRQNVSFYPITPGGLQAPVGLVGLEWAKTSTNDLLTLANETDGIAVVNTNDLNTGIKRIADDLAAYYVLGYYTTNTKFDGGIRNIKVKLKGTGKDIRSRRQYRAPTEAEIATLAAPKVAAAPAERDPRANFLGEAALFVNAQTARALVCSRTDRVRIEFPRLTPLDGRVARLLDSRGQPMAVPVNIADDEPRSRLILTLSLAPLARGSYSIELTATASGLSDRRLVPLQIQ
jgi:VWFA-related protein